MTTPQTPVDALMTLVDLFPHAPSEALRVMARAKIEASDRALAAMPASQAEREEYIADVNYLRGEEIGHRQGRADARRAQQAGGVPAGFVLVRSPITEEMHVAAVKVLHRATGVDGLPQRMLDAMLAAAPSPSAVQPLSEARPIAEFRCSKCGVDRLKHPCHLGRFHLDCPMNAVANGI